MTQGLRIAHMGSGRTGQLVLRLILNMMALDLVSHYLHKGDNVNCRDHDQRTLRDFLLA